MLKFTVLFLCIGAAMFAVANDFYAQAVANLALATAVTGASFYSED